MTLKCLESRILCHGCCTTSTFFPGYFIWWNSSCKIWKTQHLQNWLWKSQLFPSNSILITNKHYGGDISVSSYWCYNFSNLIIWCSVWICIACFLYHMFSLFCCAVKWIRKDVPTKTWKYLFHLNKFENDSEFFWTEELLSAWRDCVHKFCITI